MTHRVVALALAALIVASACPARKGSGPPQAVSPEHQAPPPSAQPKAAPERTVLDSGRPGTPSTPEAAPPPAVARAGTQAPAQGAADPAGAPSATASAYVFSPQQAATAPAAARTAPGAASVPAVSPAGSPATGSEPAGTQEAPPSPPAPEGSPEPQHGSLQLVVVASAPAIATGGVVTVDVMASSDTAVVDAPLHLSFDPRVVAFVDGTPGDFLTQGGSSVVFFADGVSRPGDVAIAAGRVERTQGTTGTGLLCRVRFRGVAAGTSPVVVGQAKAWGTRGDELPVASSGTSVVVR